MTKPLAGTPKWGRLIQRPSRVRHVLLERPGRRRHDAPRARAPDGARRRRKQGVQGAARPLVAEGSFGATLSHPARRRLERTFASQQVGAAGWPEPQPARAFAPQAGPKPAAASELAPQACIEKSICSSRALSSSTTSSRTRLGQAGSKRSGYRTLRAHSSNHSAAGPSPAGIAGGPGGGSPPADHLSHRLTRPPNPICAGRVVGRHLCRRARARKSRKG